MSRVLPEQTSFLFGTIAVVGNSDAAPQITCRCHPDRVLRAERFSGPTVSINGVDFLITPLPIRILILTADDCEPIRNGADGGHIRHHRKRQRWINQEREESKPHQHQNRNEQGKILIRKVGQTEPVQDRGGDECPEYVKDKQRFEQQEQTESVDGTGRRWSWSVFRHCALLSNVRTFRMLADQIGPKFRSKGATIRRKTSLQPARFSPADR